MKLLQEDPSCSKVLNMQNLKKKKSVAHKFYLLPHTEFSNRTIYNFQTFLKSFVSIMDILSTISLIFSFDIKLPNKD